MMTVNSKTITKTVTSKTTAINIGETITSGDSDAYILEITFSDVTSISGTVQLHFALGDGTYADRDSSDGVVLAGNKVTYTLEEVLYSAANLTMYVQFLDSNLYTPLKVSFSGIRVLPGGTPTASLVSYPAWAASVITDIAEMSDGNTGTANEVWTSDGAGDASWQSVAGAGLGDVTGPAAATDGNIALFDGITGKIIKNSTSKPADFAVKTELTGTITATWSAAPAPYTQAITVAGILATDEPHIVPVYSADNATAILERTAWGLIGKGVTTLNTITFTAFETAPVTAISIAIEVIR